MSKKDSRPSEYKTCPYIELKRDDDQGIVEHLVTVFGIVDHGKDVSHPGAFAKTIAERGTKIRVLDAHNTASLLNVVGKPLSLKEVGKDELPATILAEYPDATGGLWARTQFLMDTPEGKGVFTRIKEGAVDEFSYGYDALDYDYDTIKADGEDVEVRNLRTMRLWEYSPVLWGMNPATTMMSAKEDVEPNTTSDVELPPDDEKADEEYQCECLECGHTMSSSEHCKDIKCPECGGEARRAERPGKGEAEPDEMKPEVTENYVRIPVDKGDHEGHRIRTIAISAEKGIKALYCGECKAVITYLFDKDKWDVDEAKKWVADHKKSVDDAIDHKWLEIPEEVDEAALLDEILKTLIEAELFA